MTSSTRDAIANNETQPCHFDGHEPDVDDGGWVAEDDIDNYLANGEDRIAAHRLNILTTAELMALPPASYSIEGLLPKRGLATLYGPAGEGKTFLALSISASLSTGTPFLGHKINDTCNVLYVLGEGVHGIGPRLAAWAEHHEHPLPEMFWHKEPVQLDSIDSIDAIVNATTEHKCGVVVIDTFARSTAGLDENSTKDMGTVIGYLTDLINRTGCLVLLVHHSGKDADKGMRGSSQLHGATDAELRVNNNTLKVAKMKDGRDGDVVAFKMVEAANSIVPVVSTDNRRIDPLERHFEAISDVLIDNPGASARMIRAAVRGGNDAVSASLDTMVNRGIVTRTKEGQSNIHRLIDGRPWRPEGKFEGLLDD